MSAPSTLATWPDTGSRWSARRLPRWARVLAGGALLWGLAVAVLLTTDDLYVAAAVVLGTFVVPLALYARLADGETVRGLRGVDRQLPVRLFACGGLLGFLAAAFLENPLTSQSAPVFAGSVGVIEETAKLIVLVLMTRNLKAKTWQSGLVTGALVGLGFSAFESAGYALASMVGAGGGSDAVIDMVVTRAVITPFTHGLWTAVVGAALFAGTRHGRFRVTPLAVATLAAVIALHACWDLTPNLAAGLELHISGAAPAHHLTAGSAVLDYTLRILVSLPSLYVVYRLRRRKSLRVAVEPAPPADWPATAALVGGTHWPAA